MRKMRRSPAYVFGKTCRRTILFLCVFICFIALLSQNVSAKDDDGNIVIVLDPGHGGSDPGKVGVNGVKEDAVNYEIACAIKRELEKYSGVRVYLTREEGKWNTNTGRAMVAAALDADFLISLHNNSGTQSNAGAIVYTSVLPLYSTITADMGNYILNNLSQLGIVNNGIMTRNSTQYAGEDYYTIMGEGMRAGVPTVLVEHCFLSNPDDSLHVSHQDGSLDYEKIDAIGRADAAAVITYFNLVPNIADLATVQDIELEKGYSVQLIQDKRGTGNITWSSSNTSAIKVDEGGFATAVGSGTADVVYSYEDGTRGHVNISVAIPQQVTLVGAIDPTFYDTKEKIAALDLSSVFAQVIYSDGSVREVRPDNVGTVDSASAGVHDIPIVYGTLKGFVRVIYNTSEYVPEVTSREPKPEKEPEKPSEKETGTNGATSEPTQPQTQEEAGDEIPFDIMMIVKLAAGIIIVSVFAFVISLLEKKTGRKKNKRGRRY